MPLPAISIRDVVAGFVAQGSALHPRRHAGECWVEEARLAAKVKRGAQAGVPNVRVARVGVGRFALPRLSSVCFSEQGEALRSASHVRHSPHHQEIALRRLQRRLGCELAREPNQPVTRDLWAKIRMNVLDSIRTLAEQAGSSWSRSSRWPWGLSGWRSGRASPCEK